MADVGSLSLKLACDPGSFESGLLKAEQGLAAFAGAAKQGMDNVRRSMDAVAAHPIGAVLVGAAAVANTLKGAYGSAAAELSALNAEGTKAIGAQSSLERKFGLSAEAAGGLSLLTKSLGMDLGDVSGSSQKFQRHLGDATAKGGEAAAAFQRLGLDAGALAQLSVTEQMAAIGDALKGIPNPAERASAAFAVLGKGGADLLPLVQASGQAFQDAAAKAQR